MKLSSIFKRNNSFFNTKQLHFTAQFVIIALEMRDEKKLIFQGCCLASDDHSEALPTW